MVTPTDHRTRSRPGLGRTLRGLAVQGLLVLGLVVPTVGLSPAAHAALTSVGPTDPATGFPAYYQDSTGTKLELCIRAGDPCLAGTTVTGSPSTPGNITPETFYFVADADPGPLSGLPNSSLKLRFSLEAAFGTPTPQAGQQITFSRVNIVGKGLKPNTTYTFTHPYGTSTATSDGSGLLKFRDEIGCPAPTPGVPPCDFSIALGTAAPAGLSTVGPWLKWDPAVAPFVPAGYLGDALTAHPVVGSPTGNNFVRVQSGGATVAQTNNFIVAGKIFVPPATVSPAGGLFNAPQTVGLTTADPAATIRYTLDGTNPTAASPVYTGPLTIGSPTATTTTTLKYAVVDQAGNQGATFSQTYTVDVVAPTVSISLPGGTYTSAQTVTLSAADDLGPTTIYYTTDGSPPTTASAKYAAPLSLSGRVTLNALAVDGAGNRSPVASQAYVINVAGASKLTLAANPATVTAGQATSLTAKLVDAGGTGIAGATVSLQQRAAGATAFSAVATGTTATDGTISFGGLTPTKNTDYQVSFAGIASGPQASTSTLTRVSVAPALSLNLSTTSGAVNQPITFSGAVTPAQAAAKGGSVQFTIKRNGATIQTSGTGVNTTTGAYSWQFKPTTAGTYTVQASYTSPDTASYAVTTSSVVTFTVK